MNIHQTESPHKPPSGTIKKESEALTAVHTIYECGGSSNAGSEVAACCGASLACLPRPITSWQVRVKGCSVALQQVLPEFFTSSAPRDFAPTLGRGYCQRRLRAATFLWTSVR